MVRTRLEFFHSGEEHPIAVKNLCLDNQTVRLSYLIQRIGHLRILVVQFFVLKPF